MKFAGHGQYHVVYENNLIISEVKGPFNTEVIADYSAAMSEAIDAVVSSGHREFALIGIAQGTSIFIPEAEPKFIELTKTRKERGLKVVGLVYEDIEGEILIKEQYRRIYSKSGVEYREFESRDEAKAWCLAQLADKNIS